MNKNTESDFKTKPHRPPGQANNLPTRPPTSTPLSSQGFLILPSARATLPQPKGAGAESKNKEGPPKSPRAGRGQSRIHCLCHPTPTTAAPAPPLLPGQPELPDYRSPSLGPCPSLPDRGSPGTPPRSSSAVANDVGVPRGAAGDGGCSSGHWWIHPHLHLRPPASFAASRASSSPVVSWDQLIRVNFSQVGLTGRRELWQPSEGGAGRGGARRRHRRRRAHTASWEM